ncbi:MAG TPA: hypothetical protein VFP37_01830 [Steroidobacteraceae bacterium]|nr:hypothetical protein [Steroidobacteraceae bacterium]
MSRIWLALMLFVGAGTCYAQGTGTPGEALPPSLGTDPDVRSKRADPAAVEIPMYVGASIRDILQALVDKGFTIKWDPEQVLPTMRLLERPKSSRIDRMLTEILDPWGLRADHNLQDGGWWVRPKKKKKEVIVGDPEPTASNN